MSTLSSAPSPKDASANGSTLNEAAKSNQKEWGRVLICGGTDWPRLGRKDRAGANKKPQEGPPGPDLLEPHILRSLSNIKVTSLHTHCASCHVVALDIDGSAWLFGRNEKSSLGTTGEFVSENAPIRLTAKELGAPAGTTFVHAAVGRNHTILVGSNGQFWSAGANHMGQCAQPVCPEVTTFKPGQVPRVNGTKEHVVQAAAGITFSLILTESGRVYAFGSAEKGQLGNGKTGEHIVTGGKTVFDAEWEPIPVRGLEGKKIVQIACGQQHSVALGDDGLVYVWGYNGYCRLGLGNQKDMLVPEIVPHFSGPNEVLRGVKVVAGPSNTIVIDRQGMLWMAGKVCMNLISLLIAWADGFVFDVQWKTTGDGSGGQPWSSFRYFQDMGSLKITDASSGGVTHFALAPEDDTVLTVCFGQGAANGELGLGPDEPKSATKPTKNQPLDGIDVFRVSAAQNTSLFLAHPSDKLSDLPRHPLEMEAPELCVICSKDNGEDDSPLECDKCDNPYHLGCLDPPLDGVPDGEWFCPECEAEPGAPVVVGAGLRNVKKGKGASGGKGKKSPPPQAEEEDEDEDEEDMEDEEPQAGQKRKASSRSAPSKRKR
ncbi:RCC1/BLIP-II [Panus rudis PR-1116 ss-1]|nr:RCC1/BLIP-II [Panus rudis PR-1116 ss-1]